MAHANKKGAMAFYIVIALVLGAITYLEFAIVEYQDVFVWLTKSLILWTLGILSVVKFGLVVAIYMHLRDDDPLYTGFFMSGMIIAIGSFVALTALFTVPSALGLFRENDTVPQAAVYDETEVGDPDTEEHAEAEHEEVNLAELEQKSGLEAVRVPSPKEQYTPLYLPAAQPASFSLKGLGLAQEGEAATQVEEPAAEASGDIEPEASAEAEAPAEEATAEAAPAEETTAEETTAEAAPEEAASEEVAAAQTSFDWEELGASTYAANCVSCHQDTGLGIVGAFPPLAGHIPDLYNAEGGREYIINVVLYGLQGEINVDGTAYNGIMNPWAQLSDEEIAATLNHELTSWDNEALLEDFTPLLPEEVAVLRDQGLAPADVLSLRPAYE